MTVPASGFSGPTWVQTPGNGSSTVYNFPFMITATTDLIVGFIVGGVYTQQTSGFTVSGIGSPGGGNGGGQVTFAVAPPTGTTVDLRSQIPETQPTNFSNLGGYYPESTTNAVDRLTRLVTDLYRLSYQFGIHGPDTESIPWPALPPAVNRAGGTLVFDSATGLPEMGFSTTINLTQGIWDGFLLTTQALFPLLGLVPTSAENAAGVVPTNLLYAPGNILRYGADASGIATSNTALANAIAQARQSGGANVYIPAGAFNLGAGFVDAPATAKLGLRISGAGKNASYFFAAGSPVLNFSALLYQDLILSDFGIGNDTTQQVSGIGIQISAIRSGSIIRNVLVYGNPTTGTGVGIKILGLASGTYTGEFQIEDSEFYNLQTGVSYNGICTGGATINCRFTNGAVIAGATGIYQAATCISQICSKCQFFGTAIGIQTFGEFFKQELNYFESCSTNSFQWNLGVSNSNLYIGNFSFGDTNLSSTPSFPSAAQYGCVVVGTTSGGAGNISFAGAISIGTSGTSPTIGFFNGAPGVGPQSTWGTPTGGAVVANYPGASATLLQTSEAFAELLSYLKSIGILAA
jgi:hypothetical protein